MGWRRYAACFALLGAALLGAALACGSPEPAETPGADVPEAARAEASAAPTLQPVRPETLAATLRAQPSPYLLVNVWSTWCEPCMEEMPELVRVARRYEARGLGLMLISADFPEQHDDAVAFLTEVGAPSDSFVKDGPDGAFIEALDPRWGGALPVTLLYDADRRVRHLWTTPVDDAALTGPIDALLDERPSQPASQQGAEG